ncbi:hypothetical protein PMIN05_012469 [Paraphaeosphaeria minitans]
MLNLPNYSYFKQHISAFRLDAVQAAIAKATKLTRLKDKQQGFFSFLKRLRAGVGLVQGPGGTGKSRLILAVILYHYELFARGSNAGQLWVTSPINAQLDDLCLQAYNQLMARYTVLGTQSADTTIPYPIVIRRHMRETEKKVWQKDALALRQAHNIDTSPDYTPDVGGASAGENEDNDTILENLSVEYLLRTAFDRHGKSLGDDRLKQVSIAEGQWMLHLAGIPTEGGQLHPIADPNPRKYSQFRDLMEQYASGHVMAAEDMGSLQAAANALAADLAPLAHAIFMTPHTLSEYRTHSKSKAFATLQDEAGKTTERAALHSFVWSQPDAFHVLFGDTFQPAPVVGPAGPTETHHFYEQTKMSLFSRFVLGGASQHWLDLQHRFVPDIAAMVNAILPGEKLRTDPGVTNLPNFDRACRFFRDELGVPQTICFLQVQGQTSLNMVTKSTYNVSFATRCITVVLWLLYRGFEGEDIGIVVPYTAQRDLYIAGVYTVANHLQATDKQDTDSKKRIAEKLLKVTISTVDGLQGAQRDVILLDTTVAGKLGFMRDTSRILLAISRPRVGLIIIGDSSACYDEAHNKKAHQKTAYYKMVHYCQEQKCFININGLRHKERWTKITLPIGLDEKLTSVHAMNSANNRPYTFGDAKDDSLPVPDFIEELHGSDSSSVDVGFSNDDDSTSIGRGSNSGQADTEWEVSGGAGDSW